MKLKKVIATLLATVLMTSTVAYAEKNMTVDGFSVENVKGTYTFTDEEFAAFVDYNIEKNGISADTNFTNDPMGIYGTDSSFTIADGKSFNVNEVFDVEFEFIDIKKDANGKTTFKQLAKSDTFPIPAGKLWDVRGGTTTVTAKDLMRYMNIWGGTDIEYENTNAFYEEMMPMRNNFTHADVDMMVIWFYTSDEFDKNGYVVYPSDGIYHFHCKWLVSENGASMLKEANGAVSSVPEKPASFKAVPASTTSVKLSWKDNGADSYNIYRATSKNGTYKKIASTTKNTYTNKSLTKGKTYYYKVTAVIDGEESEFSKIVSSKPTAPIPSAVKASSKANDAATVTWKKSTGAKGYEIYMATSKSGTYERVGRVGSKVLTFTEDELTEGKTYYFKVRSYTVKNGKRIYSPFSSVVKIKV